MPLTMNTYCGFGGRWLTASALSTLVATDTDASGSGATTYTFNKSGANFQAWQPTYQITTRYLIVGVCGTGAASRTISSVSASFDGGGSVTGTELASTSSSPAVVAAGFYLINAATLSSTFTVSVTFSGAMLGAGMYVAQLVELDVTSPMISTLVTSGGPILSALDVQFIAHQFYLACQSATSVADIDWGFSEIGTYTTEGTDITYGSRMFSVMYHDKISNANDYHVGADFSSAATNPRLLVLHIRQPGNPSNAQ